MGEKAGAGCTAGFKERKGKGREGGGGWFKRACFNERTMAGFLEEMGWMDK